MLTDKHASSSAITFDITGNVIFTVATLFSLSKIRNFLYFHYV